MADVEHSDDIELEDVDDLEADVAEDDIEVDDDIADVPDEPVLEDDDDDFTGVAVEEEEQVVQPATPAKKAKGRKGDVVVDDDEEDDDEEDDDVEADLDTILKDRIAAPPDDDEDEDEVGVPETEDRADGTGKIQPRKPGEFVCQSCFLVKHPSQLADPDNMLCADCV